MWPDRLHLHAGGLTLQQECFTLDIIKIEDSVAKAAEGVRSIKCVAMLLLLLLGGVKRQRKKGFPEVSCP